MSCVIVGYAYKTRCTRLILIVKMLMQLSFRSTKNLPKMFPLTNHMHCLASHIHVFESWSMTLVWRSRLLCVVHTHRVPGTGSRVPSPLPRGWQRVAGGSGAAGWARLRSVPPATGRPAPPAHGPPLPPAGSSPKSPASSALADWAHSDSESPHLWKVDSCVVKQCICGTSSQPEY